MTDLEALSGAPVPRPARMVRQFARRIVPPVGFILFGIVYFVVVANTLGVLPLLILVPSSAPGSAPSWIGYALLAWYVVAQVASWWVFRRWMRRRQARAAALVRDGEIVDAEVTPWKRVGRPLGSIITFRGVRVQLQLALTRESTCKVLALDGVPYCFVFAPNGSANAAGIGRGNPISPFVKHSNIDPLPAARVVE